MSANLRDAIVAACSPGHNQASANTWLSEFSNTHDAWTSALALLEDHLEQVSFFAANILLSKTRKEWPFLDKEAKEIFFASVKKAVDACGSAHAHGSQTVCARLCLLLASMTVHSADTLVEKFLLMAFQFALGGQNGTRVCFLLLAALPEECERLEIVKQRQFALIMQARVEDMHQIIITTLSSPQPGADSLGTLALHSLSVWLRMSYSLTSSGNVVLLPYPLRQHGQLKCGASLNKHSRLDLINSCSESSTITKDGGLLSLLLQLLGDENELTSNAARETLVDLLALFVFEGSADDKEVVSFCMSSLLHVKDKLRGTGENTLAVNVARVASSLASTCIDTMMTLEELVVELTEMMIGLMATNDSQIAESILDFFLAISDIPVVERPVPLQGAAFQHLLPHLLALASYPVGFSDWCDCTIDEDSFHQFRNEVLGESMDMCFGVLRPVYGFQKFLSNTMQRLESWQAVEAVIFAFTRIARPMISLVKAEASKDREVGQGLLSALFTSMNSRAGPIGQHIEHPQIVEIVAKFLGDYAAVFNVAQFHTSLVPSVNYLLTQGLARSNARKSSSQSFLKICIVCTSHLANPETILGLSKLIVNLPYSSPGSQTGLTLEDARSLWEGLSRLTANLEPDVASMVACKLVEPLLVSINSTVQGTRGDQVSEDLAKKLSAPISLLSCVVRFMEGKENPGMKLVQGSWNLMQCIIENDHWIACEQVVASTMEFFQRSFLACRLGILELLPRLISRNMGIFERYHYPCCIELISNAIQLYGSGQDPHVDELMTKAAASLCNSLNAFFQGMNCNGQEDLLASFFACMDIYLMFAPKHLMSISAIPKLLEWSTMAVLTKERGSVEASLAFLMHLLSPGKAQWLAEERKHVASVVHGCMAGGGQMIVENLLFAACSTCPQHLLQTLSLGIRRMIEDPNLGSAVVQWIVASVQSARFQSHLQSRLPEDTCKLFCDILANNPNVLGRRLDAMLVDFASISRGERSSDALISYQM